MRILKGYISLIIAITVAFSALIITIPQAKAQTANTTTNSTTIKYVELPLEISSEETSQTIRNKMQKAFDEARDNAKPYVQYKIILPENMVLRISNSIFIYSNTYLEMNGATILRDYTNNNALFKAGRNEQSNGYEGYGNITIKNGTIDGWDNVQAPSEGNLLRFGHSRNILLENLTFVDNCNTHFLEIGASKDVTVKNCTFKNQHLVNGKTEPSEAVQLDALNKDGFMLYDYYDGTSCNNINFIDCTFSNVTKGIGSHAVILGDTGYYKNINITGCKFTNIQDYCIVTLCWVNCNIKNNIINNCGDGIYVRTMRSDLTRMYDGDFTKPISNYNTLIYNNSINTKGSGIKTYGVKLNYPVSWKYSSTSTGTIPAGDYSLSNLRIKENSIFSKGTAISLRHTKSSEITNNNITMNNSNSENVGIYLTDNSYNNKIYKNTLINRSSSTIKSGILLSNPQSNNTITGNNISGKTKHGIYLYNGANSTAVTRNTVSNSTSTGIYSNSSSNSIINLNTLKNNGGDGIYLSGSSTAKAIKENAITTKGGYIGIGVKNSSVNIISGNTLEKGSYGIFLSNARANNITSNNTKGNTYGIYSQYSSGKINDNRLQNAGKYAVKIDKYSAINVYYNSFAQNKNGNIRLGDRTLSNLAPPQNITLRATAYNTGKLSWNKKSNSVYYRIYRSSNNKDFQLIGSTKTAQTNFINKGLVPYKRYYYKVTTVYREGNSTVVGNSSSVRSVVTNIRQTTLQSVKTKKGKVQILWKNNYNPEKFQVYRREYGKKNYTLIRTVNGTANGCYDATAKKGKRYYYFVRQACHNKDKKLLRSKASNVISIKV